MPRKKSKRSAYVDDWESDGDGGVIDDDEEFVPEGFSTHRRKATHSAPKAPVRPLYIVTGNVKNAPPYFIEKPPVYDKNVKYAT